MVASGVLRSLPLNSKMPRLAAFLVLLLPLLLSAVGAAEAEAELTRGGFGFKATLRHVDANAGYTEEQLLARAVRRSRARVATLQSLASLAPGDAITPARILVWSPATAST